jgi:hypothetical protein
LTLAQRRRALGVQKLYENRGAVRPSRGTLDPATIAYVQRAMEARPG